MRPASLLARLPARLWLVGALAATLGLALCSPWFNPYHTDVVGMIGIQVMLAVGLNLILGHTGQFSLGHAGFMAVGAFASAFATNLLVAWLAPGSDWLKQVLIAPSLLAGGLLAAGAGLLIGIPALRLKGDYLAIVTLGFGEILSVLAQNLQNAVQGNATLRDQLPFVDASVVNVPGRNMLFWSLGLAAVTVYVCHSLVKSTYGTGLLAVRDNEVAAEACGISAARAKVVAFTAGAFFAGLAGGVFAHWNGAVNPGGFRFDRSMEVVLIVILGGTGRTLGVVLAAVCVTLFSEALRKVPDLVPGASGPLLNILQNRALLFAFLLVTLMIVRPQGLFSGWKWPWAKKGAAQ